MSIKTVDLGVQERQQDTRLLPLISGGAALILAVAAGIGLWRNDGDGGEGPARHERVGQDATVPMSGGTAPQMGGMAELSREQALAARSGVRGADHPDESMAAHVVASVAPDEIFDQARSHEQTATAQAAPMPPLKPTAVSDQEMYQRWRQAQAAGGPEPVNHPGRD